MGEPRGQSYFLIVAASIFPYTAAAGCALSAKPCMLVGIAVGAMQSFEFQIVLNAPLKTVFAIYVDTDRWRNRNLFGDIRWVQGTPWEEGSRLRIETRSPIPSTIDQVVQHFEPHRKVVYLSHVFGITCETQVRFTPVSEKETAIHVGMHLVGATSRALGFALEPAITKATKGFFEELKRDCEWAAREGSSQNTTET